MTYSPKEMGLLTICENRCLCTCLKTTKTQKSCCWDLQLILSAGDINACPYKWLIESFIQPIHSKNTDSFRNLSSNCIYKWLTELFTQSILFETLFHSGMKCHYCVLLRDTQQLNCDFIFVSGAKTDYCLAILHMKSILKV